MADSFDLIVIGGGSGGSAVARRSAGYGAKVCIIERGVKRDENGVRQGAGLGGTCVNVGCVPKKLMFMAAQRREEMVGHISSAKGFGYTIPEEAGKVDWAALKQKRDAYVKGLNDSYSNNWTKAGIETIMGLAFFEDKSTVKVALLEGGERTVTAPKVVIACGGEPALPDVPGKELAITSDGFFDLEQQPKKAAVLGAGYIAVEMAGILHGLGSETQLFFRGETVLRRGFDPFIQETLMNELKAHGPSLRPMRTPSKIEKAADGTLTLTTKCSTSGEEESAGGFDVVLSAIGRRSVVDLLALDKAGVALGKGGLIQVDQYENTNVEGIYAIGDCTVTGYELTPVAIAAGRRLGDRLFGGEPKARIAYETIATVVFSHPPIGTIGFTEPQAREEFGTENVVVKQSRFNSMQFAFNEEQNKVKTGLKLVLKLPEEKVVGLHCIGPSSDEMLQGFAVAVRMGATRADFEATVAIHPTIGEEFVTFGGWGQVTGADGKLVPQLPPYLKENGCCPSGSWPACTPPEGYKPKGEEQKLGDLPVYLVGSGQKGIVLLPDIFPWSGMKGRFPGIADTLAAEGYCVLLADPFRGDSAEGKADFMPWIKSFPYEKSVGHPGVGADIEACVKFLQDKGCSSVGCMGFCWGVWAMCKAMSQGVPFKCGVGPHPSTRLEGFFGGDEQAMMEKVEVPVLLMPAGNDPDTLKTGGAIAKHVISKGGKSINFPDMAHGFASRGDLTNPAVARDVELAMKHAIQFFKENL
eukprot:TRINITY_DN42829_c0_g1_i1.p1 TRINITY_DN42829_c0_g1~~TRINITY_DN42829_c0_g1_i1.p1  ORF type:complete len:771 (-),score=170.84 TRINITY_DN42829_c0_g1_i1:732-2990(-)